MSEDNSVGETPVLTQESVTTPDGCDNVVSMSEWIQNDKPDGFCRPCILPVTIGWYIDELQSRGQAQRASDLELRALDEGAEPLQLADLLDKIKHDVDDQTRARLLEFDCATQNNGLEEDNDDGDD